MSFFDQVYEKLFPKKEQKSRVLVHELIKRSDHYLKKYQKWTSSPSHSDSLKTIATAYYLKAKGVAQEPEVHILNSRYSNGFAVSFQEGEMDHQEFQYLFDWLADTVEQIGYKRSNSDVTIMDKGNYIETREKHYLKPVLGSEIPTDQRYGNILIEHILIDGKPSFLKLVANIYSDRSYSEADSFESLAEYLFALN